MARIVSRVTHHPLSCFLVIWHCIHPRLLPLTPYIIYRYLVKHCDVYKSPSLASSSSGIDADDERMTIAHQLTPWLSCLYVLESKLVQNINPDFHAGLSGFIGFSLI